jgi:hypothetical protein
MAAVEFEELLAGQEAQPERERHPGRAEVLGQPAGSFDEGFLDDVGRVDARLQPPVESQADHAPQALAMLLEEIPQGLRVAPAGAPQEVRDW